MTQYVCFFVVSSAFYTCHRFQNDMTNAFDRAKQQEMALALLVQKEIKMPKTMPKSVIDIFIIGGALMAVVLHVMQRVVAFLLNWPR